LRLLRSNPLKLKNTYLLLGSNIEPRISFLKKAEQEIQNRIGELIKTSSVYETAPWGFKNVTSFLNKVLLISTELEAEAVLEIIHQIEEEMGRVRSGNSYSSRTIDIDILYFGLDVFTSNTLQIPHPRLHLRKFTLLPLVEVAPDYQHPKFHLKNKELLQKCTDQLEVKLFKNQGVEV